VKISVIGTGLMGLPMAERLLSAQHSLTAYNRTAAKLDPLQKLGAAIASSPQAAIAASNCVVLMLTDAAAIQETVLSEGAPLEGRTIIQMGTIAPQESQAIRDQIVAIGGEYLEAPVLGSIPEAKSGTLLVMVGAESAQFERWLPVLQCFGPEPILLGEVGAAAAVKLALNQLIGSLTSAFALSLGLVQRQGANVSAFMDILRQSALYAPTFDKKLDRMLRRNFENPNFPTKHLQKDMDLFIRTAIAQNLRVDSAEGVKKILADAGDLADADYSALFSIISPES
jgi:3-hydroxyisobutyrate dehydrogenase